MQGDRWEDQARVPSTPDTGATSLSAHLEAVVLDRDPTFSCQSPPPGLADGVHMSYCVGVPTCAM